MLEKLFAEKAEAEDNCEASGCPMPSGVLPSKVVYAMAYVPFQQWETPYDTDVALSRGTIFPCLDKPFIGEEAVKRGNAK